MMESVLTAGPDEPIDHAGEAEIETGPPGFTLSDRIVVLAEPGSERAEAIGALRTHLVAQHLTSGRRALALCSPNAGVGCTTLAVNLAVSLAEGGVKTLLVDADLRNPSVQRFITPSREVPGLRQCLSEEGVGFAEAIQSNVLPNLSVLYSGGRSTRAQELLANPRFKHLTDVYLREYDVTIVDTPPSNASADARRVAAVMGYALMVVGRDRTFISDVKVLAEELVADRSAVIGSVLNLA